MATSGQAPSGSSLPAPGSAYSVQILQAWVPWSFMVQKQGGEEGECPIPGLLEMSAIPKWVQHCPDFCSQRNNEQSLCLHGTQHPGSTPLPTLSFPFLLGHGARPGRAGPSLPENARRSRLPPASLCCGFGRRTQAWLPGASPAQGWAGCCKAAGHLDPRMRRGRGRGL